VYESGYMPEMSEDYSHHSEEQFRRPSAIESLFSRVPVSVRSSLQGAMDKVMNDQRFQHLLEEARGKSFEPGLLLQDLKDTYKKHAFADDYSVEDFAIDSLLRDPGSRTEEELELAALEERLKQKTDSTAVTLQDYLSQRLTGITSVLDFESAGVKVPDFLQEKFVPEMKKLATLVATFELQDLTEPSGEDQRAA
jgi:hypothetical protein